MKDLPASHYLNIYQRRIGAAERGITKPTAAVLKQFRALAAGLGALPSTQPIRVEERNGTMVFIDAVSGTKIGGIDANAARENG